MATENRIRSVAIIGAGAAGAAAAAAFKAEDYFEQIRVFERRGTAGGTWIYDPDPHVPSIRPGGLPADLDKPLEIPTTLPATTSPNQQERFVQTPIYDTLTTNVPAIAMSFSDSPFPYGPFVPHHVPRQYIENYFSKQRTDDFLSLNTTVEDVSLLSSPRSKGPQRWKLTLRKYDPSKLADVWWEEKFDAVILANGHYSIPWIPEVTGLAAYMEKFPGRVIHSKYYRSSRHFANKKAVIIGNSASGHDITTGLVSTAQLPVYQSRRSLGRWDGDEPLSGVQWKPIIKEFKLDGTIVFDDGTVFKVNGRPLWDYESNKLIKSYWHTFLQDFPRLAIVGIPRVLTFRSFEYQAVALARLFSGRNALSLPSLREQERWEKERDEKSKREHLKFHDIRWETGETMNWLDGFFQIAGLGRLTGEGRIPPAMTKDLIWAIENIKKYPEPGNQNNGKKAEADEWVVVNRSTKDLLHFI
ncbi:hypothetical protein G7Z17_g6011 [Cylindrodendrum hubeiense]|uniref:Flavin-containing monooxygenase n=1 Tax=Cylindrodendrum hubeiense TaxID=595255 RepID=A0A9P5LB89_9HYPO|nr:hypothetical protein G7Z17_g6011 [Cylindrodendrum hubeiense]